jgi:PTS system nitrogen regulatory IIA component
VLHPEAILPDLQARDKKAALEELVDPVARQADVDAKEMVKVLMDRERLGSTGIGEGIGIPHGKMKSLESLHLGIGVSRQGIEFESIDGKPVYICFLFVTPENSTGLHLRLLARISRILKNEPFREKLLEAGDRDAIYEAIRKEDEEF